jgi:rhodanese-related sulfurtransferase
MADEMTSDATPETSGEAFEAAKDTAAKVIDKADEKENQALKAVEKVQDTVAKVTPVPDDFKADSSPSDLKARLEWGEPALSILDVRDREEFNRERITGAMPMPIAELIERAQGALEPSRDLFVYSSSDEQAVEAATQLYNAGFEKVSAIKGGLAAWKAIGGPVEGQASI